MRRAFLCVWLLAALVGNTTRSAALVLQTDFGLKDGAVAAMKGVAYGVSPKLRMFDLTHEIPPFNVWEAAYRLKQTARYWPKGTVFVSVVDPGVGTRRKSVVLKTRTGQFFVTPDNGTLTFVAEDLGIAEVREIDETVNRRPHSQASYTFHGRDVYAYVGARLAAGVIRFEQVGPKLPPRVVKIPYQKPTCDGRLLKGCIPVLDPQFGNVWTNIDRATFAKLHARIGDALRVVITRRGRRVAAFTAPYVHTFGDVPQGRDLAYLNSLLRLSFAVNMGNLAERYHIGAGPEWSVEVTRAQASKKK